MRITKSSLKSSSRKSSSLKLTIVLALFAAAVSMAATGASAQTVKVLYTFNTTGGDGYNPEAPVIFGAAGHIYGTTVLGGAYNRGTVFELSPAAGGGWTETIIHSFKPDRVDGLTPISGLAMDGSGNLYGTTSWGGADKYGVVYELSPSAGGSWTEAILHSFGYGGGDGVNPGAAVILDSSGNLYGTTRNGASNDQGAVFELSPESGGHWTEKILHSFKNNGTDGLQPQGSLIFDAAGNLWSTTLYGGTNDNGTVFELTPATGGAWAETIVHSFVAGTGDGTNPFAGLVLDQSGNFYGTTAAGGSNQGNGTVFEVSPQAGGGWKESVLHSFTNSPDGSRPYYPLVLDAGNLYGTTWDGGVSGYLGSAFEMTATAGGGWTDSVIYSFTNHDNNPNTPYSGLTADASGKLYGTTYFGGTYNGGTVYEITPWVNRKRDGVCSSTVVASSLGQGKHQQVPPLRRRFRSGFGRDDRVWLALGTKASPVVVSAKTAGRSG